jgi:hypothetical protein
MSPKPILRNLAVVAIGPWALASFVTIVFFWLVTEPENGDSLATAPRDLVATPNVLVPVAAFTVAHVLNAQDSFNTRDSNSNSAGTTSHEVAFVRALALTILATALVAVIGSWAGMWGFAYQLIWSIYSGYSVFVFIGGCVMWWPTKSRSPAGSPRTR